MINHYITFLYGVLVKIVDDINDLNIFMKYKGFFEVCLILLTIYILWFNEKLAPIAAATFGLGGLVAYIFVPHAIEAVIWKLIIFLSLPVLLSFIPSFITSCASLNTIDAYNAVYFIMPLFIICSVFAIIEDYIVPEEYGTKKTIDKLIQTCISVLFILFLPYISEKIHLSPSQNNILNWLAWAWFGNVVTSVIILTLVINKN